MDQRIIFSSRAYAIAFAVIVDETLLPMLVLLARAKTNVRFIEQI